MNAIPINMHKARGTYRPDRHKPMPLTPIKAPAPPKWMNAPEKKKWREVAKLLCTAGICTQLDLDALGAFVVAYTTWQTELALLKVEGTVYTHNAMKKMNPRTLVVQAALRDTFALARELGLTIISRRRNRIEISADMDATIQTRDRDECDLPPPDKKRFFKALG